MIEHKSRVVSYVSASATGQNEARQLEGLGVVDRRFTEMVSGESLDGRAQLHDAGPRARGDKVREGDFILTMHAAIARIEQKTIRERRAEVIAIAIAIANGMYDAAEQSKEARRRVAADAPKEKRPGYLGAPRQTLYAALGGSGRHAKHVAVEA